MESAISLMGHFLSKLFYKNEGNIRNQYCQETISNVKWRISLASLLTEMSKALYPFQDRKGTKLKYSKWAVVVRDYLPSIVTRLPIKPYIEISEVKFQVERGLAEILVPDHVSVYNTGSKIRTTTIHNIKGETLDSVMVVSSLDKKSKGGHWEDWFNQSPTTSDEHEHKRYGYVAMSRPKHLLVLATPKLRAIDRAFLRG
ncbi:MAG: hypothetical protein IPH20_15790 [Bacteroidales bacterium]|nr:hypothetical protein [Bacteroidales bacterium]